MKPPPYIKFFCDRVTGILLYYHHSAQCVMVVKTTLHYVMGCEIVWMWQSAKHRLTEKSYKKAFILRKEVHRPYDFCSVYDQPTLPNFHFHFA